MIHSPTSLSISAFSLETDVQWQGETLLGAVNCDAEFRDQGGQAESLSVKIGTLELLEGAAWLLEKRMVEAVNPGGIAEPPPIFPYRVAEQVARFSVPGIGEEGILACILSALQDSDGPSVFPEVLAIAREAVEGGCDPVAVLREHSRDAIVQSEPALRSTFASLEGEFSGDSVMAVAIRRTIDAARPAATHRT